MSKDGDLSDMSLLRGSPPKVIWLQIGNCTTAQIESLLRGHREDIEAFGDDSETGILALS